MREEPTRQAGAEAIESQRRDRDVKPGGGQSRDEQEPQKIRGALGPRAPDIEHDPVALREMFGVAEEDVRVFGGLPRAQHAPADREEQPPGETPEGGRASPAAPAWRRRSFAPLMCHEGLGPERVIARGAKAEHTPDGHGNGVPEPEPFKGEECVGGRDQATDDKWSTWRAGEGGAQESHRQASSRLPSSGCVWIWCRVSAICDTSRSASWLMSGCCAPAAQATSHTTVGAMTRSMASFYWNHWKRMT